MASSDHAWRSAATAAAVPWLAFAGGAAGAALADALGLTSADERFALVGLGLALPLLLADLLRRRAKGRLVLAALGAPWIGALVFPRSPIALSWLAGGVLCMGVVALVHAGRRAWPLGASAPTRVALTLVAVGPGLYLWLAAATVLVNTELAMAPVRLAHQRPETAADELDVSLLTDDDYGIEGTYTPGAPGAGAVLLVHGVADGRGRWLPWVGRLRQARLHVLRIDLRAHGRSDGAVVTYGQREVRDVAGALAWLRAHPSIDHDRLALVGTSMGGGIVLAASGRARVRAVVALAPASSYGRLVEQRTALLGPAATPVLNASAWLAIGMGQTPMTDWRPADSMSRRTPILVAHGTADTTIPIAMSRELAAARPNVELVELGCGHDDIPAATAATPTWARVHAFLTEHGVGGEVSAPSP
ncbi:MAG: alpha/beta fold hydrolase [Sandaracinaceae bacterium]|nr:alpha/beta fold hydrolase [Sandaracinaceae bacterium]